jgi:hypothetical protein
MATQRERDCSNGLLGCLQNEKQQLPHEKKPEHSQERESLQEATDIFPSPTIKVG